MCNHEIKILWHARNVQWSNTEERYSSSSTHIPLYFPKRKEELASKEKLSLPSGMQNVGWQFTSSLSRLCWWLLRWLFWWGFLNAGCLSVHAELCLLASRYYQNFSYRAVEPQKLYKLTNQVNHKEILLVCGVLKSFNGSTLLFFKNDLCSDFAFPAGHETCSVFSSDACWKSFCLLLVIISDVLLGWRLQFGWLAFVTAFKRKPLI